MGTTPIASTTTQIQKPNQPTTLDSKEPPQVTKGPIQKWVHAPWPPVMESPAVVRDAFAVWSLYQ